MATAADRSAILRAHGLDDSEGLRRLLDHADESIGSGPAKALELAGIVTAAADDADEGLLAARGRYIQARAAAFQGDLNRSADLIDQAQSAYERVGDEVAALRTGLGRMHVLTDLGRPAEALQVGESILGTLGSADDAESRSIRAVTNQNRGYALYFAGNYAEALEAIDEAGRQFAGLDMDADLARNRVNRGLVLLGLGRASEARDAFDRAAAYLADLNQPDVEARVLTNLGNADLLLGNFADSLQAFEQARRRFADAGAEHPTLVLDTADAHLALNLYPEALEGYRRAEQTFREQGALYERGRALWGLGAAMTGAGEYEEAERSLVEAADVFGQCENPSVLAGVLLEHSALQGVRGHAEDAMTTARHALDLAETSGNPVQRAYGCLRLSDLLFPNPDAEAFATQARELGDSLGLPWIRYRCDERLGRIALEQGREAEAESLLSRAIDDLEAVRGTLPAESLRASFLRDKMRAYESLVALYLRRGDRSSLERAFAIAEQAKSRSLVDMMVGVIDSRMDDDLDEESRASLRQMRSDLNAIYSEWLGDGNGQRSVGAAQIRQLQSRAVFLERQINRLYLTAGQRVKTLDRTLPLADIKSDLITDTVLVAFHVVNGELVAFVTGHDEMRTVRTFGALADVTSDVRKLNDQWHRFRAGLPFVGKHTEQLHKTTLRILQRLYHNVFEPLEAELARFPTGPSPAGDEIRNLVIIPHGPLHNLPFHALHDGDRYLVERFRISYAPSATVYTLCSSTPEPTGGVSTVLAFTDEAIPEAAAEAAAVAEQLENATTFVDQRATLAAFHENAAASDVIHFACHGLFRVDNPMFSALKLSDGWLTASDVAECRLQGAQITLSACESGRSHVMGGDELIGLTRAFLGAGATSVVVSQWIVQDESAASLMTDYYRNLKAGLGRAEALRAAQLAALLQHPHPFYWAPYILVGKR